MIVKETGILMIEDMVDATFNDLKLMTSRVLNPQPANDFSEPEFQPGGTVLFWRVKDDKNDWFEIRNPYGLPGDLLYVKETHYRYGKWVQDGFTKQGRRRLIFKARNNEIRYYDNRPDKLAKVDQVGWHKRPSIFMPKFAARLWLEIESIQVRRIQDISIDECICEGINVSAIPGLGSDRSIIQAMQKLWDSINAIRDGGIYSWDSNPWVFAIKFKRVER